jgi:hypothetical protein
MTRLRGLLEEERVRFKGAMVQMKQKHTVAVKQSMVLGKAVVEVEFSLNLSTIPTKGSEQSVVQLVFPSLAVKVRLPSSRHLWSK